MRIILELRNTSNLKLILPKFYQLNHKYSISMNITESFRRKNKYHKPIIVFKEFYRDYFKHAST